MEKKKSSFGCFAFLRRRKATSLKPADQTLSIQKTLPTRIRLGHDADGNPRVEYSPRIAQKLLPVSENHRSKIITPSRRTPQIQRFLPEVVSHRSVSHKDEFNASLETELSRPATLIDMPNSDEHNRAIFSLNEDYGNAVAEDKKMCIEKSFIERVKESYVKHRQVVEESEQGFRSVLKDNCNQDARYSREQVGALENKFNPERANPAKHLKLMAIPELIENQLRQDFLVLSGDSPDIFSNSSRFSFNDKNLPVVEISPIECIPSNDDFTDIMSIINNIENLRSIPDVFIRSNLRAKQLPVLKPTTPCYITKRRVIPVFRQNNKELLGNLT